MSYRRFSQAISEGDGISVVAAVEDAAGAREAESQRAEALVVRGDPRSLRDATTLPILWRADVPLEEASEVADAYLLVFERHGDDEERLAALHVRALELGLDCVVDVRNEEELDRALEALDPEIFLLSPREANGGHSALECVLGLLPDVPAGKLAIADLPHTTRADVAQLERAGVDAVIVRAASVAELVGNPIPEV
jgi:indole-3-glycerol phosphate synthase